VPLEVNTSVVTLLNPIVPPDAIVAHAPADVPLSRTLVSPQTEKLLEDGSNAAGIDVVMLNEVLLEVHVVLPPLAISPMTSRPNAFTLIDTVGEVVQPTIVPVPLYESGVATTPLTENVELVNVA
jgi:hypothetical protein